MKEVIDGLTMDTLFDIAKGSYNSKKTDDFILLVIYDKELNYIKSISKERNPESKKNIPNDKTFKYEVLDFKTL